MKEAVESFPTISGPRSSLQYRAADTIEGLRTDYR